MDQTDRGTGGGGRLVRRRHRLVRRASGCLLRRRLR
jgi:hypothetical protein